MPSSTHTPKVSVIVPLYNQGRFLPACLESLQAQTFPHWEAIVVNDGSTDDSLMIAEDYAKTDARIRIFSKPNGGLSSTRNYGLDHATAEFIQFLDADDILLPEKLERQLQRFSEDPAASISVCRSKFGSHEGLQDTARQPLPLSFAGETALSDFIDSWEFRSSVPCHCFLFRSVVFQIGGLRFDPRLVNHEDFECWVRLLSRHPKVVVVDECLVVYRLHAQNMTRDHDRMRQGFLAAVDLLLLRPELSPAVQRRLRAKRKQINRSYVRLQKADAPSFLSDHFPKLQIWLGGLRERLDLKGRHLSGARDWVRVPFRLRRMADYGIRALNAISRRLRPSQPWILAAPNPVRPRPVHSLRLFAIVGAWMEGDVIFATVKNAFAQGCERVYLVDNDSPDDTVEQAEAAGAILARRFKTERYDERLRLQIMNDVVREISVADGGDHIWWLWLDADEFPHGPRGLTVEEFLRGLDRRFRIVGARFINHFPSSEPAYIPGYHPLDFQPLCEEHRFGCALGHRKHPLQRYDRRSPSIVCDRGFHEARSEERPLLEPTEAILLHHFPYRNPASTKMRLAALCAQNVARSPRVNSGDDAADGMEARFETLEAIYRGDWKRARNYRPETGFSVPNPILWAQLAGNSDAHSKRWYSPDELDRDKASGLG